MLKPTISVVIPTCDRPKYLAEALESVLRQTSQPEEILIIDNGRIPVDETVLPNSELIRVIRALPRFGVSQARNLGAISARYDFISFLDDDDSWDANYLDGVRRTQIESGADIILGRLRDNNSMQPLSGKQAVFENKSDLINQILLRNPGAVGSNTTVSRSCFNATSGYDPAITTGEDKALVLDLLLLGATAAQASTSWVNFRDDGDGPRQTELPKRLQGKWRFLSKYWSAMNWRQRLFNLVVLMRLWLRKTSGRSR